MSMSIAVTPIMLIACTLGSNSLQKVQDIIYQCAVRFIDGQSSSCMKGIDQADAVFYTDLMQSPLNVISDINNVHWFLCFNLDHIRILISRGGSGSIHLEGMDDLYSLKKSRIHMKLIADHI